jgi:hypothetical protein
MCDSLGAFEINMKDLNTSSVTISKPKKIDSSLFAKVKYNNNKLFAYIYNANIVHHTFLAGYQYSIVHAMVAKDVTAKFVELDAHIMGNVINNAQVWFNKGLEAGVIEEYYTPTVGLVNKVGPGIKIRVQSGIDQLAKGCYDLLLHFKGIRFYKQRFVPEWELVAANMLEDNFLNQEIVDDEDDDEFGIAPCAEDLTAIVQDLQQQATTIASSLSAKKREIKKKLAMVAKVQNALNGADIVHTEVLDQIHEKLLEFTPDTAE